MIVICSSVIRRLPKHRPVGTLCAQPHGPRRPAGVNARGMTPVGWLPTCTDYICGQHVVGAFFLFSTFLVTCVGLSYLH